PMGLLLRPPVPGKTDNGAPAREPRYGGQFNNNAVGGVKPEGKVEITYEELPGQFADGEAFSLRKPTYKFYDLGYGPMDERVMVSPRIAQDRKSTRLNSSHVKISYAVFCLKKKKKKTI